MNKPLYENDFFAWTQAQTDALRRRSVNELDRENVVEEVESMGRHERSELQSHFVILPQHLLKGAISRPGAVAAGGPALMSRGARLNGLSAKILASRPF